MTPKKVHALITGKSPLIYLISEEEDRVERLIKFAAERTKPKPTNVYIWSCLDGLTRNGTVIAPETDPVGGLDKFLGLETNAVLIFKDLHLLLDGNTRLIRKIKECRRAMRQSARKIFFVCPHLALPDDLFSIFKIEDVALPGYEELSRVFDSCLEARPPDRRSIDPVVKDKIVRAAQGFTFSEAIDAFETALALEPTPGDKAVYSVLEDKQHLVRKSGVLEYVDTSNDAWQIGGLINLKKWLTERTDAFGPAAAKAGLPSPKGILVMGISGCGKSLCIKAIACHWKLPLLRLDMGRIYDGLAGPPEEAMRKAIKTSEAVAPCVLWIDEIEAGIANQQQKQGGGKEARVLAMFLTWMQEKTAPVFVGATANEVEVLPPEILRKGRFDELFYMGLPLKDERKQILSIHMKKMRLDLDKYDIDYLADSTDSLNGAEIEQGIISAVFESASKSQELTEHVLANNLRNIVPLSRTMRERIQKIEAWARDRAMKASLETIQ